jgi:ankyrin repeat protein
MNRKSSNIVSFGIISMCFLPWTLAAHLILSFGSEETPLMKELLYYGSEVVIQKMIAEGKAGSLEPDAGYDGPLHYTIPSLRNSTKFMPILNQLIDAGADVNEFDILGPPLLDAAFANDTEVIKFLIKRGADVDRQNCYGETALMKASEVGRAEALIELLNSGANKNIRSRDGTIALDKAKTERIKGLLNGTQH